MPAFSGKFQYQDQSGPCQFTFDEERCVLTPESGAPLAFDLGDVDTASPGEWELQFTLFTRKSITLRQFGSNFGRMSEEWMAAWRDRTVRCLLLEDLEETGRYDAVAGTPAQVRLYKTNLAVLPLGANPIQWRLADVDSITFDEASYSVVLQSGKDRLVISKLAKKTDEFLQKLRQAWDALRTETAEALHKLFPLLNPDQLRTLVTLMPEGRSVRLSSMAAIHPKLPELLTNCAVSESLKPYFDALRRRADQNAIMAGFKFIRKDEMESDEENPDAVDREQPLFFWFFFPIAGKNVVAWEASTGSGRATYFFRYSGAVDEAVSHLTRGLALVNFRREPVYLSDDALIQQPKFYRYAIGARKLPDLRAVRAAMMGRAIHSTVEEWSVQANRYS